MKKAILSAVFLSGIFTVATAQTQPGESVISANAGFSLVGALFSLADIDADVKSSAPPAVQLNYDYAINELFSLGGGLSYQRFKLAYTDYGDDMEDFDVQLSRFNVALRGLFHYGAQEQVDMYSGIRLGLSNWSADVGTSNPDFEPPKGNGISVAPQLILFGIRGYLTDGLGINAELAVGGPHFFAIGLSYRI
ncbi:MAG: hypothetical protein KDC66_20680 [Phaeodactylibacter sp.]|nr:hypothetical protein [Phaeodactylibacter sp.]MCB9272512.1 hypothetical protein [Lewinellaceae bacterium]